MAVYTALDDQDLHQLLARYRVGDLVEFTGIKAGVENSNWFVTTTDGEYVLTVFEKHPFAEVPYFLNLTAHLAEHDVPCAHPIADAAGDYLQSLRDKPAALIERLPGRTLEHPDVDHCRQVGDALGRMHIAGFSFAEHHANERGPQWWFRTSHELEPLIDEDNRRVLAEERAYIRRYRDLDLPRGTIHADLFRDNILFDGDELAGMIDFYYACDDCLLYDVAVTVNDWCGNADGRLDEARSRALLAAYHARRPFTAAEGSAWNMMLRCGALRFWLSRLLDLTFPRPAEIAHTKDPDEYRHILLVRREEEAVLWPLADQTATG